MTMAKKAKGPRFIRYFDPLIKALKQLGGSGRPPEVFPIVARLRSVSDQEQSEVLMSGASRFENQVAFARQYLVWSGHLDSSKRGVWSLTEKGLATSTITEDEALRLFNVQHSLHKRAQPFPSDSKATADSEDEGEDDRAVAESSDNYKEQLLNILKKLPPEGFERICQRLLRESGFERVTVTGGPHDRGIDGIGVLQINSFVSFKVLFQCKRYAGSVSRDEVATFRNSMLGRSDKGIILTTGTFTSAAREEASRDGALPIELVDGQKLVELFQSLELGLRPKMTYELDLSFLQEFM